jgi:hypothetical protein
LTDRRALCPAVFCCSVTSLHASKRVAETNRNSLQPRGHFDGSVLPQKRA